MSYPNYPQQPGGGAGAPYSPYPPGAPGGAPPGGAGAPYPSAGGDQMGFVAMPNPAGGSPYPPAAGGSPYPPAAGGSPYPPAAGGSPYPPAAGGSPYPPAGGGYPPQQQGYPPAAGGGGYPPAAGGYPTQQQSGYPGYPQQQHPPMTSQSQPMPHMTSQQQGAGLAGRYQLSVACKKLKDLDVMSKSDPVCVMYQQMGPGAPWKEVGRTEQIKNNLNPSWQTKFSVEHPGGGVTVPLRFEVFDWDSKSKSLKNHDFLARQEITLDQVLLVVTVMHSGPSKGGHFIVTAEKVGGASSSKPGHGGQQGGGQLRIKFAARNLDKKDTFGKSDPYFVIYRMTGGGQMTPVHKSEVIKNNLNPQWQPFTISVQQLCGGNRSARLKIDVLDHDDGDAPDLIGSFLTSLDQLSQGNPQSKRFPLVNPKKTSKRGYRDSGELFVQDFNFL